MNKIEDYIEFKDYILIQNDKEIAKSLGYEQVILSDKLQKSATLGFFMERNIIITNLALYNFNKTSKIIFLIFIFLYFYFSNEKKGGYKKNNRHIFE